MFSLSVAAQTMWSDSVKIYFKQSRINYVPTLHGNQSALDKIADSLAIVGGDTSLYRLRRIHVVGAASPEGSIRFNKWLSEQRAATLFNYLTSNGTFLTSVVTGAACSAWCRTTTTPPRATRLSPFSTTLFPPTARLSTVSIRSYASSASPVASLIYICIARCSPNSVLQRWFSGSTACQIRSTRLPSRPGWLRCRFPTPLCPKSR